MALAGGHGLKAAGPGWPSALRRAIAFLAAALAIVTIVASVPQHVLDWDEDGAVATAAATLAHGTARTVMDHHALGHACAGHCAAHVLADAPENVAVAGPRVLAAAWLGVADSVGRSVHGPMLERPPRA